MSLKAHLTALCLAIWTFFAVLAGPVGAQANLTVDFEAWENLATRAETAINLDVGASSLFETLRGEIDRYRAEFDAARDLNSQRIATLRDQLAALGPLPADGEPPEPAETRAQRDDLSAQLNVLLDPVQRAQTAFVRANAIIGQIDRLLRERQTNELLQVKPSPLNPGNWPNALTDLRAGLRILWQERPSRSGDADVGPDRTQRLPLAITLAILGALLLLRGTNWSDQLADRARAFGARGTGIWRFVASLLRIVLPFGGLLAIAYATIQANLLGPKGQEITLTLAFVGGIMLGVRWVAERVFARREEDALIPLSGLDRARIRFLVYSITVLVILAELVVLVVDAGFPADSSKPVLVLPFFVLSAAALYRIGVLLRKVADPRAEEVETGEARRSTIHGFVRLFGLGAMVVAIASVLLLCAGYYNAVDALLPPYIMTLVILGFTMTLQRFGADVYGAVTGRGEAARDMLLPVLLGMLLFLASLPALALVWGARMTDLSELWSAIGRGFFIGDVQISPSDFLAFALIFAIGYMITRLVQSTLKTNVLPKTRIDLGGQNAIVSGIGYVGLSLAAIAATSGAGLNLSNLAIVAGALSVGLGFGLQNIVNNFVSGIILLIERPISEGDWIEVGGQMGYVRDISVRSTRIETFDRTDVIVPNADLISGTVTNYTRGNTVGRVIVPVGVAYGTDTRKVEKILREIADEQPMVLASPPPAVLFLNFGADALEFEIRCVLRDVNWMLSVKNDMNHEIAKRFAAEGIEIPFAQRDVWLRNPETLAPAANDASKQD